MTDLPLLAADDLLPFAAAGRLYRFCEHVVAAKMGSLLLVPIWLIAQDDDVCQRCPVPFNEFAALVYSAQECKIFPFYLSEIAARSAWRKQLAAVFGERGWTLARVEFCPEQCTAITGYIHASGACYARVP